MSLPRPYTVKAGTTRNFYRVFGFVPFAPPTGASYEPDNGGSTPVSNQKITCKEGWETVAFTAGAVDLQLYVAHSEKDIAELPDPPPFNSGGVASAAVVTSTSGLNAAYGRIDSGLGTRSTVQVQLRQGAVGGATLAFSNAPTGAQKWALQPGAPPLELSLSGAVALYAETAGAADTIDVIEY